MSGIPAAGETFCWDRYSGEGEARDQWMHWRPGRTVVDDDLDPCRRTGGACHRLEDVVFA